QQSRAARPRGQDIGVVGHRRAGRVGQSCGLVVVWIFAHRACPSQVMCCKMCYSLFASNIERPRLATVEQRRAKDGGMTVSIAAFKTDYFAGGMLLDRSR